MVIKAILFFVYTTERVEEIWRVFNYGEKLVVEVVVVVLEILEIKTVGSDSI